MSTTVDDKIVSIKFDNAQFEKGVGTSLDTLDKLKKGLNLEGAAKGLDAVSVAANKVTFEGMSSGIEAIKVKFGLLQIVAVTALANIANSAVNAGKSFVSSLTIDPIKLGYSQYEGTIKATRTMMAGTGETIDIVGKSLDVLNKYANDTIYSFADMTANISKFTNAGLSSKDATSAIIGISNAAALSGASAEDAGRAMYQLGQAMAGGYVQLMDWNSVDNANMGTVEFKNQLLNAAVAAGTLKKNSKGMFVTVKGTQINAMKGFNLSLQDQWMTTAVLSKTLRDYGSETTAIGKKAFAAAKDVTSGTQLLSILRESVATSWTVTWQTVIGDANQAKALWTSVSDAIGPIVGASGTARNNMLAGWTSLGGRTKLISAIGLAFTNVINIVKAVTSAFQQIFPPTTANQFFVFVGGLKILAERLTMSKTQLEDIHKTFAGLFAILDIGVKVFEFFTRIIGYLVLSFLPVTGGIASFTGSIGDFFVALNTAIEKSNGFRIALNAIYKVIDNVKGVVGPALGAIGSAFGALLGPYIEQLKNFIKTSTFFADAIDVIKTAYSQSSAALSPYVSQLENFVQTSTLFADILDTIKMVVIGAVSGLTPFVTIIKNVFGSVGTELGKLLGPTKVFADTLTGSKDAFKTATDGTNKFKLALDGIVGIVKGVGSAIGKVAKAIYDVLSPVFKFIKDKISGISLGDVGAALMGAGFLVFAKALLKMLGSISDIANSFSNVIDQVANTLKAFQLKVKAQALLTVAIALGILAAALIALSFINIVDLGKSLGALGIMVTELVIALKILDKGTTTMNILQKKGQGQLIGLGISILLLANAIKILSVIPLAQLAQGTVALAALMSMIAVFVKTTKGGDLKTSAGGLVGFAIGITILAGALAILGKLKVSTLVQGTEAIAGLMLMIGVFVQATNGADLATSAGGLTGFAIGIAILAGSLTILGKLKPATLIQGALAITALMTMIGIFVTTTKGSSLVTSAGGLIAFSIGITILCGALAILGHMDSKSLIQGGLAITAIISVIANFVKATSAGDLAASSAGIMGFAVGLIVLTAAVKILGDMDTGKVIQGTAALAGLILVIGLFVSTTSAGDLATSSAGMIGFAVGLTILTVAVAILAAIDPARITQGVLALAALMVTIGAFVNLTSGGDLAVTSAGLIAFSAGIAILAGVLALLSALDTAKLVAASLAISAFMLSVALFVYAVNPVSLIATAIGMVAFSGAIMVMAQALQVIGNIPIGILAVAIGALAAMFVVIGLSALILAPLTPIILALSVAIAILGIGCLGVGAGMLLFAQGISVLIASAAPVVTTFTAIVMAVVALIPTIAKGLADGLVSFINAIQTKAPIIWDAIVKMVSGMITTLTTQVPKFALGFATLLGGILSSITQYAPKLIQQFLDMILRLVTVIYTNIPKFINAGINIIVAFIDGISQGLPRIIDAAFRLVITLINGIANAINNNAPLINKAVGNLINSIVNAVSSLGGTLVSTGGNIIQGIITGVTNQASNLAQSVVNAASGALSATLKFLGIQSPSKVFREQVGVMIGRGMADGIKKSSPIVETAASKMSAAVFAAAKAWIDNRKFYNNLSAEEELYVWTTIASKYKVGSQARIDADKEVYTAKNALIADTAAKEQKAYDNDISAMDAKKYYNKLTLDQELADYLALQKRYKIGTIERTSADKEVYRLKNEISKKQYDDETANIDNLKFYKQMNLTQELTAWQKIQKEYAIGTEERKNADRQIFTLENSINDINKKHSADVLALETDTATKRKTLVEDYYTNTKAINDKLITDISSVNKAYDDAVTSRAQSIYSSYSLFDDATPNAPVSGTTLIKNLQDQVIAVDSWKKNIAGLSSKGVSDDLMKEFTNMGPQAASQITAMNNMSSDELSTYVTLWQSKHNQAKTEAVIELEDLRSQTVIKIGQLNTDATIALNSYTNTWLIAMIKLNTDSNNQLTILNTEWTAQVGVLSIVAQAQFTDMATNVGITVETLRTDTEASFTTLATNIQTIMSSPDWASIGSNIILGIKSGVTSKSAALAQEVARIALMALMSAKAALGIHSPSTEFAKVGEFAGQGLINGLVSYGSKVATSASDLGSNAINAISDAIAGISDVITSNIDSQPVIRPVFDLSNIQNGSRQLYSMMSGLNGYAIDGSVNTANLTANSIHSNRSMQDTEVSPQNAVNKGTSIAQTVNIYSPTALSPSETARQNKRALQELALQF